jgi:ribonuclease D
MNTLRSRRSVAIVRELWYARDDIARDRDTSIGRVLPDAALVEIAKAVPSTIADLPRGHRAIARYGRQWVDAVRRAVEIPEADLPPRTLQSDGPPPPRVWAEKNPLAADRLGATRSAMTAFAQEHVIPVENVCSPDPLRRVVWQPPADLDEAAFTQALLDHGCRDWQAEIVAPLLVAAFEEFPGT